MSEPIVFDRSVHAGLIPSIVSLHVACIGRDHMMAHFLPPLEPARMNDFWLNALNDSTITTFITLSGPLPNSLSSNAPHGAVEDLPTVTGVVQIRAPFSESEPYKADVLKLMVSPDARKQGIAKKLMARLEVEAERIGRPLLVLDTEAGSPAEKVYPRLGYTLVGVIPDYGFSPKDGSLRDDAWYYKDLRKVPKIDLKKDNEGKN